jgi:hypothetical protein
MRRALMTIFPIHSFHHGSFPCFGKSLRERPRCCTHEASPKRGICPLPSAAVQPCTRTGLRSIASCRRIRCLPHVRLRGSRLLDMGGRRQVELYISRGARYGKGKEDDTMQDGRWMGFMNHHHDMRVCVGDRKHTVTRPRRELDRQKKRHS